LSRRRPQASAEAPRQPSAAGAVVGAGMLAAAAFLLWRMADPLGVRPDSWSEAEVIISGINYAAHGFWTHAALPQHQITPPDDPYFLYANYPVLSNLVYGLLHRLGADAGGLFRVPAIAASVLALWLWYRLVARIVDRATGAAAAVALATSFGFLAYADNIHQQAYGVAPQFGAFLCFVVGVAPQTQQRRRWLAGCAACLLLLGLITVELHLWMLIALAGYTVLFGAAVRRRRLLLLALPLCVGVALQWVQVRVGSPVPAAERPGFAATLYRRSIGFDAAADTPYDASGRKLSPASYPGFMAQRFRDFYLLPVWAVPLLLAFGWASAASLRTRSAASPRSWPPQMKLLVIVLAAGLGWMVTMMQQSAVHPASMRQLLAFYALLLGVLWVQAVRLAADRQRSRVLRLTAVLVALGTLAPHARASWAGARMHLDHGYHHDLLQEPGWQESVDFAPLRALPPGRIILTNHNRLPLIRYWSRHPAYLAPNSLAPGSGERRNWLELTLNHLRGLYGDDLPRLIYMYRVVPNTASGVAAALGADPLLRALTAGAFAPLSSPQERDRAAAAFAGERASACPTLLRGSDWVAFDMTPVLPQLLAVVSRYPIPRLSDMPAPR
jgi:hypothetical protein